MAETTNIEWCDATFNPWIGCTKVSPGGCANCYAEVSTPARVKRAAGVETWGPHGQRQRTSVHNWKQPLAWNAKAEREGRRLRVFCASLADVFDNAVPPVWRADLFKLIGDTPHLDWLLLTKRVGNVGNMIPFGWQDFGCPPNVWIGATVVNQEEADRDIPKLLAVPARVRFLSIEPMLGPITLREVHSDMCEIDALTGNHGVLRPLRGRSDAKVHWVICGGESGHNARPMHPDWARQLRDQCAAADVPFLFKQWGEWVEEDTGLPQPLVAREGDPEFDAEIARHDGFLSLSGHFVTDPNEMEDGVPYRGLMRPGKKPAGRLLDGRTHDEFPIPSQEVQP